MMPDRNALANLLSQKVPLRSPEGVKAIQHLTTLIAEPRLTAYQPLLQPMEGRYPTPGCGLDVEK
jgi:hypothetical protein